MVARSFPPACGPTYKQPAETSSSLQLDSRAGASVQQLARTSLEADSHPSFMLRSASRNHRAFLNRWEINRSPGSPQIQTDHRESQKPSRDFSRPEICGSFLNRWEINKSPGSPQIQTDHRESQKPSRDFSRPEICGSFLNRWEINKSPGSPQIQTDHRESQKPSRDFSRPEICGSF